MEDTCLRCTGTGSTLGELKIKKQTDPYTKVVYFSPKPSVRYLVHTSLMNSKSMQQQWIFALIDIITIKSYKFTVCLKLDSSLPIILVILKFAHHQSAFVSICLFILLIIPVVSVILNNSTIFWWCLVIKK